MHFSLLPTLSLFLTLSAPILATPVPLPALPDAATIEQDIRNIDAAVRSLDNTIKAYQGVPLPTSLVEGTPVLLGVAEIHKVNRAGFAHALVAKQFTAKESGEVVDVVVDTVNVSIPEATKNIKGKVAAFKEGGLVPVVIASLTLLLNDHDTFSAAVVSKFNPDTPADKIKEGNDAIANIHNVIQDAIVFYTANLL